MAASGAERAGDSPVAVDMTARGEGVPGAGARHVAIIMDGNGRWAERRGLPRAMGHREGVQALKRTVQAAGQQGVRCLTVFGFSTENWRRPADEVSDLMGLVRSFVGKDLDRLAREGVRIKVLGRRDNLPVDIAAIVARAEADTAHNDRFILQVAFNYGGRADLIDAARRHAEAVKAGAPNELDEAGFGKLLSTAGAPPLDLIIRTSGELRLSNFLLWEAAYAELVFQDILWPDYGPEALADAMATFAERQRRFGGRDVANLSAAG
jgi:undecaprenyl diphosphate synthase